MNVMQPSTKSSHVSLLGSSRSVTRTPKGVGNDPVTDWMPGVYDRRAITEAGQDHGADEESWADLAASARADWAAENPF